VVDSIPASRAAEVSKYHLPAGLVGRREGRGCERFSGRGSERDCYARSGECMDLDLLELLCYTSVDCQVRRIDAPPHGAHALR
jgi:hypothetical protein